MRSIADALRARRCFVLLGGGDDPVLPVPADAGRPDAGLHRHHLQRRAAGSAAAAVRPRPVAAPSSTSSISPTLLQGEFGTSFLQRRPVFDHHLRGPAEHAGAHRAVDHHRLHLRRAGRRLARLEARLARSRASPYPLVLTLRAAPEFWLGMVLLRGLRLRPRLVPVGRRQLAPACSSPSTFDAPDLAGFPAPPVLPAATLALYLQGLPLLLMRSNMLDVLQEDFVTMARMKGLSEWRIVLLPRGAQRAAARSSPPSRSASARRSAATS